MELPTDIDYIIAGTGLIESIIAASLSITGNSVLHIDSENYYGGLMTSFRFPDLLDKMTEWAQEECATQPACSDLSNLAQSCRPIFRRCSSSFYIDAECPEPLNENKQCGVVDKAPTSADVLLPSEATSCTEQSTSGNHQPALVDRPPSPLTSPIRESLDKETSPDPAVPADHAQPPASSVTALAESSDHEGPNHSPPRQWSQDVLKQQLRRLDLDIMPKIIYADSPMVTAMLRTDVTRYLEFRPVSRLLTFASQALRPQASSPQPSSSEAGTSALPVARSLIKMPVSRGEVFRTRIFSLAQKRHLVGFLEWCASLSPQDMASISSTSPEVTSHLQSDDIAFLDRPLMEYLQNKRSFDPFTSQVAVTCLSLSTESITLRDALPKFRRLLSSMNRVGPYPLLWPLFGCADIPQAFCRLSAVFSGVYCLHRTIEAVTRLPDPGVPSTPSANSASDRPRRLRIKLSSGEEINTSGFIVSALNSPTSWVLPQVHRWLARAILISSSSIYPKELKPHDISLLPIVLPRHNENSDELAFLLEIPVEERNTNLFVAHMWASCQDLKDPRKLFSPTIDILYRKGKGEDEISSQKPQLLWACFFALPDLSNVAKNFNHWFSESNPSTDRVDVDPMIVVPGLDTTLSMDAALLTAESVFNRAFSLIHRGFRPRTSTGHTPSGETDQQTTSHPDSSTFLSLEAHWDGVFPPSPPSLEDLILMETEEPEDSSGILLTHPSLAPSGHGDWSTSALEFSLESEQDSIPPEP
ncbi:hypothetical protein SprV_0401651100 [Sparganum proliferum]